MAKAALTLLLVGLIGMSTGCTTPTSGGSAKAGKAVAFTVFGQPVTVQELVTTPEIRQSLREYLFRKAVDKAAAKMGLKPDMTAVDKQFLQEKQSIIDSGMAWGDWLQASGFTEDEIKQKLITRDLITQYMKAKLNLSEKDLKQAFEQDKEKFLSTYASQHHLTDAEKSTLTFEKLKDFVRETVEPMKMEEIRGKESLVLIDGIDLDLSPTIKDTEMAKLFEDLIINFQKSPYRPKPEETGTPAQGGPGSPATSGGGPTGSAAGEPAPGNAAKPGDQTGKDKGGQDQAPPPKKPEGKKGK